MICTLDGCDQPAFPHSERCHEHDPDAGWLDEGVQRLPTRSLEMTPEQKERDMKLRYGRPHIRPGSNQ